MRLDTCAGLVNQKWIWQSDGTIRAENGLCLDLENSGSDSGGRVIAHQCHGGANQRWTTSQSNHGGVQIHSNFGNPNDLKCMSSSGGGGPTSAVVWVDLCGPQYIEQSFQRGIANPHRYIGLGDSYSAGNGVGPYPTGYFDTFCYSATNKYSRRVNEALRNRGKPQYAWVSGQQCSGANTSSYWGPQDLSRDGSSYVRPAQRGYLNHMYVGSPINAYGPAFNAGEVALVTITIGGNDIFGGFRNFLEICLNPFQDCTVHRQRVFNDIANLRPRLREIYRDIAVTAPNAAIRVLNYPLPIEQPDPLYCLDIAVGFTQDEYLLELDALRELNRAIRDEVAAVQNDVGTRLSVVDLRNPFNGHAPCGAADDWINGVRLDDLAGSFHPNERGHWEMAQLVANSL